MYAHSKHYTKCNASHLSSPLKALLECVRLRTFGKFGLQQMQVDSHYLQIYLWRFVSDEQWVTIARFNCQSYTYYVTNSSLHLSLSLTHTHTHTHTRARAHARTHTPHTHPLSFSLSLLPPFIYPSSFPSPLPPQAGSGTPGTGGIQYYWEMCRPCTHGAECMIIIIMMMMMIIIILIVMIIIQ